MSHIYRYVSVVSATNARPAANATDAAPAPAGSECNYSDNYYGDQVCRPQVSR